MSSKSKKCRVCRPQTKSSVLPLGTACDQISWLSDFTTPGLAGRGLRCVNGYEWKTVVEATTVWRTGGEGRGWGAEVIWVNSPRLHRVRARRCVCPARGSRAKVGAGSVPAWAVVRSFADAFLDALLMRLLVAQPWYTLSYHCRYDD